MAERGRKKDNKKCGVCGDNALGSNFNAITCESCKAFFRRNALKTKEFKCPFENQCNVDLVTRRFCQKCRLKKCFAIGMKKEWIMSEEEKKAKREKIEKNRQKRHITRASPELTYIKTESADEDQNALSPIFTASPLTPQTPSSMGVTADLPKTRSFTHQPLTPSDCEYSPPAKMPHLESTSEALPEEKVLDEWPSQSDTSVSESMDSCEVVPQAEYVLPDSDSTDKAAVWSVDFKAETDWSKLLACDDTPMAACSKDDVEVCEAQTSTLPLIAADFSCGLWQETYDKAVEIEFLDLPMRGSTSLHSKELSSPEQQKLDELLEASGIFQQPVTMVRDSSSNLLDVVNMTDYAIRRIIYVSKQLIGFKTLCQQDQIALLKGGCTEMMILRSVISYDEIKNCWEHKANGPKNLKISIDVLKESKENIYDLHKAFITSFKSEWRKNDSIMLLLSCIALFTPERPNTIHKKSIKFEQDTYYYLLKRYLNTIYETCEAKETYLFLIQKVQELRYMNDKHVRVYLELDPKLVEPLLIEIFDLK